MFTRIFTVVTSLGLVVVLVFFVAKRDLYFVPKRTPQKITLPTEQPQELKEGTKPPENTSPVKGAEGNSPISTPEQNKQELPSEKEFTKAQPLAQKKSAYTQMEEGRSDTDEAYRPTVSPCSVSMGYTIGTFDAHFGISKEDFIQEIESAAMVWRAASNKNLFHHNEQGPLIINLIYDERQAQTEDLSYLALDIDNAKRNAELLEQEYESQKADYNLQGKQLTEDSEAFQIKYKAYGDKVTKYNSEGGAPQGIYESMTVELENLKQEAKALEARKVSLLQLMETINNKVARYNEFVAYINTLIKRSNSLGAKKFTEGRFTPRTNTIDIYQYSDKTKLRRVLSHELGHVLGINHNDNVRSIMYSVNSATTTTLSKEDFQALKEACSSN